MTADVRICAWSLFAAVAILFAPALRAETLPPPPARHFNDYAGVVPRATAETLDRQLAQFERESSNQLVVAVFPRMDTKSSVEDYTVRVAESWKVGGAKNDNGAVLFVFLEDRQLYLQVGYGLEPVLTDALSSDIIRNVITPRFRAGDIAGGLRNGVAAMISAAKGEYQGTGRTHAEASRGRRGVSLGPVGFFIVLIMIFGAFSRRAQQRASGRRGLRRHPGGFGPGLGGFGGFGGFGGGGSSGGGFSGGGGSFGGGGAGGRW